MLPGRLVILLCVALGACDAASPSGGAPGMVSAEARAAALNVADEAARDCPWPADLGRYEQTTFSAKRHPPLTSAATVVGELTSGCGILAFTVDDSGIADNVDIVSENPAGFGRVAKDILHLNDYAEGASSLTTFIVRIGGRKLTAGGAIVSLGFKDTIVNFELPP
jgi:hypothetical protein